MVPDVEVLSSPSAHQQCSVTWYCSAGRAQGQGGAPSAVDLYSSGACVHPFGHGQPTMLTGRRQLGWPAAAARRTHMAAKPMLCRKLSQASRHLPLRVSAAKRTGRRRGAACGAVAATPAMPSSCACATPAAAGAVPSSWAPGADAAALLPSNPSRASAALWRLCRAAAVCRDCCRTPAMCARRWPDAPSAAPAAAGPLSDRSALWLAQALPAPALAALPAELARAGTFSASLQTPCDCQPEGNSFATQLCLIYKCTMPYKAYMYYVSGNVVSTRVH